MEFFSSNWLENLTKMLFVLIDWSARLLRRRLNRNSSQQMSQKNFSIWREELHALAKEFQVSCIIKIDHKQPTINPYFMKKLCRSSWCYHNEYDGSYILVELSSVEESTILSEYVYTRYTFSSNHNIHKSLCGLCFWASDPLIDRF